MVTSLGPEPISANAATMRAGAAFSPVSTRVTEPSSARMRNELMRSQGTVGTRQSPGAERDGSRHGMQRMPAGTAQSGQALSSPRIREFLEWLGSPS